MTELEKMQRAKMYIDKLANGINPLDGMSVGANDIVNNVRISRCLFYVSDILGQVIGNGGNIAKRSSNSSKTDFFIPDENISNFRFSDKPIPISEIANRLNELTDLDRCKKITYKAITSWLIEIGALEIIEDFNGKQTKNLTAQGFELGITKEKRTGLYGEYVVILYSREAQQFIVDNIEAIVEYKRENVSAKSVNQGQLWTPEQEECLTDMFNKNASVSEMAKALMRTEGGIRSRLVKLGLIKGENVSI